MIVLEGSPKYYPTLGFEYAVPLGITITLPDWHPLKLRRCCDSPITTPRSRSPRRPLRPSTSSKPE